MSAGTSKRRCARSGSRRKRLVRLVWRIEPHLKTPGMAFLLYLGLYSFGRFFISFERVNNILFLGLREAQLVALIVLVLLVPAALWLRRREPRAPSDE